MQFFLLGDLVTMVQMGWSKTRVLMFIQLIANEFAFGAVALLDSTVLNLFSTGIGLSLIAQLSSIMMPLVLRSFRWGMQRRDIFLVGLYSGVSRQKERVLSLKMLIAAITVTTPLAFVGLLGYLLNE
jgi:hypothetical protein